MCKTRNILIFFGVMFLISSCVYTDAIDSCRARGGHWTEYDITGKKFWPGRCVGATTSHTDLCEEIKEDIRLGSLQELPSYCGGKKANKAKTGPAEFIRRAEKTPPPLAVNALSHKDSNYMIALTSFVTEIMSAKEVMGKLSSISKTKPELISTYQRPEDTIPQQTYKFLTEKFNGEISGWSYVVYNDDSYVGAPGNEFSRSAYDTIRIETARNDNQNIFSSEEQAADWMASIGFDVLKKGNTIHGVKFYNGSSEKYRMDPYSYHYRIWGIPPFKTLHLELNGYHSNDDENVSNGKWYDKLMDDYRKVND